MKGYSYDIVHVHGIKSPHQSGSILLDLFSVDGIPSYDDNGDVENDLNCLGAQKLWTWYQLRNTEKHRISVIS